MFRFKLAKQKNWTHFKLGVYDKIVSTLSVVSGYDIKKA